MSVAEKMEHVPVFTKIELDNFSKKCYGLSSKDLEEIYVFINEFADTLNSVKDGEGYDDFKAVVERCNKIPSHCGWIVVSYFVNNYGADIYNSILLKMWNTYKGLSSEDASSTKSTDMYETIACLICFSNDGAFRKFIINNFEVSKEMYVAMRKRPGTNAYMSARYAELFVLTKFNDKYSNLIYENYKGMIDFLSSKDWGLEIDDVVRVNFNQLKAMMQQAYDNDKRETLTKINRLINKKADIGEAFFYFVALNVSCATEVISKHPSFGSEFVKSFLYQMQLQYTLEIIALLGGTKLGEELMPYVQETYRINDISGCFDRLKSIAQRKNISRYGLLLRQNILFPNVELDETETFCQVAEVLVGNLSSVANNLTADMSELSMSISIVPLGRSRVYQDIMDKIEGVDLSDTSSFVAKMRNKDVIKKIRESKLSWLANDQYCGYKSIALLRTIMSVYGSTSVEKTKMNELLKKIYSILVAKYGIIMTFQYFESLIATIYSKGIKKNHDNEDEDYEDIKA